MPASAKDLGSSTMIEGQVGSPGVTTLTNETLHSTIIQYQAPTSPIPLTGGVLNLVFQTKASCPGTLKACTFVFDDNIQVGNTSKANNQWAVCIKVDGKILFCPVQGVVGTAFGTGSLLQTVRVTTHGPHTLQVYVGIFFPAKFGYGQADYLIYTP
jgi:hypothetical protein